MRDLGAPSRTTLRVRHYEHVTWPCGERAAGFDARGGVHLRVPPLHRFQGGGTHLCGTLMSSPLNERAQCRGDPSVAGIQVKRRPSLPCR